MDIGSRRIPQIDDEIAHSTERDDELDGGKQADIDEDLAARLPTESRLDFPVAGAVALGVIGAVASAGHSTAPGVARREVSRSVPIRIA